MVSKHISDKEATFSQTATRLGISNAPSGAMLAVFAYSGAVIGSITQSGTMGVSCNILSDYRLKENVTPE